MSESFVDKVISAIPVPTAVKKRRKPTTLSLAARKKKLTSLQKALGKLVKDVEKLAKSIAAEEKKAKTTVRSTARKVVARKPAARRK